MNPEKTMSSRAMTTIIFLGLIIFLLVNAYILNPAPIPAQVR